METKIITYGTAGYSDLLRNFYKNLDSLGLSDRLKIFCLDDEVFYNLNTFARKATVIKWISESPKTMVEYGKYNYHLIMEAKLDIISQELPKHDYILYSDADVFFNKNPLPYLEELSSQKYTEAMFMLDWNGDMCAGFFLAKNCKNCEDLFKPESLDEFKDFDQTLINNRLKMYPIKHNILDAKLFSNGPLWRGGVSEWSLDYFVTHHNAISAFKKESVMREYGHWIL